MPQNVLALIPCPTAALATTAAISVAAVQRSARVGLPAATPAGLAVALFATEDSTIMAGTLAGASSTPTGCVPIATLTTGGDPHAQTIAIADVQWGPYLVIARLDSLGGAVNLVVSGDPGGLSGAAKGTTPAAQPTVHAVDANTSGLDVVVDNAITATVSNTVTATVEGGAKGTTAAAPATVHPIDANTAGVDVLVDNSTASPVHGSDAADGTPGSTLPAVAINLGVENVGSGHFQQLYGTSAGDLRVQVDPSTVAVVQDTGVETDTSQLIQAEHSGGSFAGTTSSGLSVAGVDASGDVRIVHTDSSGDVEVVGSGGGAVTISDATEEGNTATIASRLPSLGQQAASASLSTVPAVPSHEDTHALPAAGVQVKTGSGSVEWIHVDNTLAGNATFILGLYDSVDQPANGTDCLWDQSFNAGQTLGASTGAGQEGTPFANGLWMAATSTAGQYTSVGSGPAAVIKVNFR